MPNATSRRDLADNRMRERQDRHSCREVGAMAVDGESKRSKRTAKRPATANWSSKVGHDGDERFLQNSITANVGTQDCSSHTGTTS